MSEAWSVIITYLAGGIGVLVLFDMITGRIRRKMSVSAIDTQLEMAKAQVYLGKRMSVILFVTVMWLFWPAVIIGAVIDKIQKGGSHGQKEQGACGEDTGGVGRADGVKAVSGQSHRAEDAEAGQS